MRHADVAGPLCLLERDARRPYRAATARDPAGPHRRASCPTRSFWSACDSAHVPFSPRRHARMRALRHGAPQPEFPRAVERRRPRHARGASRGDHRKRPRRRLHGRGARRHQAPPRPSRSSSCRWFIPATPSTAFSARSSLFDETGLARDDEPDPPAQAARGRGRVARRARPRGRPFDDRAARIPAARPTCAMARIVRQDRRQFRVYDGGLSRGEADEA